jgi:hypothetical protein
LTEGAAFNVFSDIGTKARPPKVTLNEFFCLKTPRVACSGMIMEVAEEVKLCSGRHMGTIFVI